MTGNVIEMSPAHRRPEHPFSTEVVRFSDTVVIGFDTLRDTTAVAWREVDGKTYVLPCPDVATALVMTLMAYAEIMGSKKTRHLSERHGFEWAVAEDRMFGLYDHYGPHLRFYAENGLPTFDNVFDREGHLRRHGFMEK